MYIVYTCKFQFNKNIIVYSNFCDFLLHFIVKNESAEGRMYEILISADLTDQALKKEKYLWNYMY